MNSFNRRSFLGLAGASATLLATPKLSAQPALLLPTKSTTDSLPMQLWKSLTDEQRMKVGLPANHPRRQYVSNWWYIHPNFRIPATFTPDQQELIRRIFDSLHSPEYIEDVRKQVQIDQYAQVKNAPAAGFFGTPDDPDFEFIFTGHHVTRRCNAHTDRGQGFGGAPIFYGHYPHAEENMRDNFNEAPDHPGNPYWYQGRIFNQFVQGLNATQQQQGLVSAEPRSENPESVISPPTATQGLAVASLSTDQKKLFIETMQKMLAMFRTDDVTATIQTIEQKGIVDRLHVSWFAGRYDIGGDRVWDTWQIEGPDMVWYFRGQPHIHCYLHLRG